MRLRFSWAANIRLQEVAGYVFLVVLGLVGGAQVAHSQTPAGTEIRASVEASYEGPDGRAYQDTSNTLLMIVTQVGGVDLEAAQSLVTDPGTTNAFSHTVTNVGNGNDSMTVSAQSSSGWPVRIHIDVNGNGALDPGDPVLGGPVPLVQGETVQLVVAIDVPPLATIRGSTDTVVVTASSQFDAGISDSVRDLLEIREVGVAVSLTETVDRTTATTADLLTYSVTYAASGFNIATGVEIKNVIPIGTTYVPGTMKWNGSDLTDAAGDDAGFFDIAGNRVLFRVGDLSNGDTGTVSFQVRVN